MINLNDYSTGLVERDGILFSKKISKISYPDDGNEDYYQIEDGSFWFNHRNNCIAEVVKKFAPDSVFFDIGAGNGFVARRLENEGISTVSIEPGIQGCLNAKKRNLKNIICSTLEDASFNENSMPAIGLFDVVEHIKNDGEFLTDIYRLLNDNGLVFITVPAFNWLWSKEDNDAGHFRRYTKTEMEEKLKSVGFKIEYSTYIFSILVAAVYLFRALPGKIGLSGKPNDLRNHKKDHKIKNGFVNKALHVFWKFELKKIRNSKTIPIGGSCFVIARK